VVDRSQAVRRLLSRFLADESATTAIEYVLIAAGVSIAILVGVQSLGSATQGRFTALGDAAK
jgi:pilus assembly protein Flp/PilA